MKKYLLAGAVILLSTVAAVAGPTTWIRINGTSDYFGITRQGDTYAQMHYRGNLAVGGGVGMFAVTHDEEKSIVLTDVQPGETAHVCYNFSLPLKNLSSKGNPWNAYFTSDGKTIQSLGSGTYTVLPGKPALY